jgi:hypothetical protein
MHAIAIQTDVRTAHVTIHAEDLKPGMTIQVTDYDAYRDDTDTLVWEEITWQATVDTVEKVVWNARSEMLVRFTDGPPAWLLKSAEVPLVMGPVNASGKF